MKARTGARTITLGPLGKRVDVSESSGYEFPVWHRQAFAAVCFDCGESFSGRHWQAGGTWPAGSFTPEIATTAFRDARTHRNKTGHRVRYYMLSVWDCPKLKLRPK